jgi:predicted P-loop ATPase
MSLIDNVQPLIERVRTDVTAAKTDEGMRWTHQSLTESQLKKHFNGGPARGCAPIKNGESTTRSALFDLDAHDQATSWDDMVNVASRLTESMNSFSLAPIAFRSSGGHGIHLFMIWDEPQDAHSVIKYLEASLDAIGFKNGTGGVHQKQIEIFPKQDSVDQDGYGNQFILPLAGESRPLEAMLGFEVMDKTYPVVWDVSDPVIFKQKEIYAHRASRDAIPLERLEACLNFIDPDVPHDDWVKVLMGIHYESSGNAAGQELAINWSSQGEKYINENEVMGKWRSFRRDPSSNVISGEFILGLARSEGWVDPDMFELVSEQPNRRVSLERNKNGEVISSLNNVLLALCDAQVADRLICYDEFKDEIVWTFTGEREFSPFRDTHYTEMRRQLEQKDFKSISREMMRDAVHYIAEQNKIDTAIEWIERLTWDGVPRVKTFFESYFSAESSEYTQSVGEYLWSSMAGRVLEPGVKCDMVPILVGAQGVGKSMGVAALVPSADFATEISFSEKEDDLSRKMRGRLVAEIGELRGLHTREMTTIKQFVTRTHENWIPKYREFATTFPRRLVFIGTTNEDQFLADATGNRRWLPMRVGQVDVEAIKRDVNQLWAEGVSLFKANQVMHQAASRLAGSSHDEFMYVDQLSTAVEQWFNQPNPITGIAPRDEHFVLIHDVLVKACGFEPRQILRRDEMRVGNILKTMGWARKQIRVGGERRYVYQKESV